MITEDMPRKSTLTALLSIVFLVNSPAATFGEQQESAQSTANTKAVLLGTGTPAADPDRWGPSLAVVVDNSSYLIDCGVGVVRRAAAAARNGMTALEVTNLDHVFITHLHSDHTLGYPDFILSPWVLERSQPLEAYGPAGLSDMTEHILKAYEQDIYIRLFGLERANSTGYKVKVHEIESGVVYEDDKVKITAFPVVHGSWHNVFGFKFETNDRRIVISGDSTATDEIVTQCDGCDLLVHEVYCEKGLEPLSLEKEEEKPYFEAFHTSSSQLAALASQAKPRLLVLYHQMLLGASEEELLGEIREHYSGVVVSGKDLDVY